MNEYLFPVILKKRQSHSPNHRQHCETIEVINVTTGYNQHLPSKKMRYLIKSKRRDYLLDHSNYKLIIYTNVNTKHKITEGWCLLNNCELIAAVSEFNYNNDILFQA